MSAEKISLSHTPSALFLSEIQGIVNRDSFPGVFHFQLKQTGNIDETVVRFGYDERQHSSSGVRIVSDNKGDRRIYVTGTDGTDVDSGWVPLEAALLSAIEEKKKIVIDSPPLTLLGFEAVLACKLASPRPDFREQVQDWEFIASE